MICNLTLSRRRYRRSFTLPLAGGADAVAAWEGPIDSRLTISRRCAFTVLIVTLLIGLCAQPASACNIPVFRYALERWKSDPYEMIVLHDTRLSVEQNLFVRTVEASSQDNAGNANVKLVFANVDEPESAEQRELWESVRSRTDATLPYVVVRTKLRGQAINCWHGSLDAAITSDLLQSPARREIQQRLLDGDAVVWLLVTSDDNERTESARELLQTSFPKLTEHLSIPDGVGLPGSELFSEVPLLLQFSVVEVDRNDPREQLLVKLLSGLRRESYESGEPLVIPVFGRGRALEVIPASDLDHHLVEDLTAFLSGPCSCQVKDRNPGFDLLMSAQWDADLFGEDGERPPATSVQQSDGRPKLLTIPPGKKR